LQITRWFIEISLVDSRQNRNAGDFSDAAGKREMALKCGSLPRDAGDLTGLQVHIGFYYYLLLVKNARSTRSQISPIQYFQQRQITGSVPVQYWQAIQN